MEVVAASPARNAGGMGGAGVGVPPYQRRDVEEWSHLDHITGMLEHARRETDHWTANTHSSHHNYGKVVDSRDRCAPDGSQQHRQRRQLEVFQAQVPGGSLQVIRTQTVATSSSRWSTSAAAGAAVKTSADGFENLQLALNPLDLSSQKTKASVGRSGSIGGRRPPSRPRSIASGPPTTSTDITSQDDNNDNVTARLQHVSQLCQQLHHDALATTTTTKPSIYERQSGDGSVTLSQHFDSEQQSTKQKDTGRRLNTALRGNNIDLEALDQILKSISSSSNSSNYSDNVSLSVCDDLKTSDESEKDKKRHSFITVESLQEVRGRLRRLSSPVNSLQKSIDYTKDEERDDGIDAEENFLAKKDELSAMPAVSRVKSYVYGMEAMLNNNNKKPIIGTGSLESRTSNKSNGNSVTRSEDWYNRRKSYGFEQVHNQQIDQSNSISLRGKNKIESSTDSGICRSTEIVVIPSTFKSSDLNIDNINKQNNKIVTSYGNNTVINFGGDNKNHSKTTKEDNELFSIWNRRARFNNNEAITDNKFIKKDNTEQITIKIPIVSEDDTSRSINNRKLFHRQISNGTSMSIESSWSNNKQQTTNADGHDIKRHSIAVDESKYVNRNGDIKYPFNQLRRTSLVADNRNDDALINLANDGGGYDDEINGNFGRKQKKVEFCKTEVHFAAESGRVNIVETDEKPPPTQNFRRRRRNSSVTNNHVPPEDMNKNGLPVTHFGDTSYEKNLFRVSDQENSAPLQNKTLEIYNDEIKSCNNNNSSQDNASSNTYNSSNVTCNTNNVTCNSNNVITVSSISVKKDYETDIKDVKENQDNENPPRGILKNKMIKPKPYLLGDDINEIISRETCNDEEEGNIWGVRLKPIQKQEETAPIWRSTVTVQNTYNILPNEYNSDIEKTRYDNEKSQPEFQKLLNSLRPARKSEPSISPPEASFEQSTNPNVDLRRSSWSVADRVKQVEDLRINENKGYSTKVNFESGEATVVENVDLLKNTDRHTTWPHQEETQSKDEKIQSSVLNKGLIVRIGREDSNRTLCSKTTTNQNSNSTTTTTKITIDMSPSPTTTSTTNIDKFPIFNSIKLPRASLHSLKSTSLIMNTFTKFENVPIYKDLKTNEHSNMPVPEQLAALRRLYDEAAEHSDDDASMRADEEVRSYMNGDRDGDGDESDIHDGNDEVSSVVSGSWSKMRAFRNIKQHLHNSFHAESARQKETQIFLHNVINRNTYKKKDFPSAKSTTHQLNSQKNTTDSFINSRYEKNASTEAKISSIQTNNANKKLSDSIYGETFKIDQKYVHDKTQYTNNYLSSPSLVGSSIQKSAQSYPPSKKLESVMPLSTKIEEKHLAKNSSAFHRVKESPNVGRKYIDKRSQQSSTYTKRTEPFSKYNEIQSPKFSKKLTEKSKYQKQLKDNKPDLLQHHSDTREYVNLSTVIREDNQNAVNTINKSKTADIKKVSSSSRKTVQPNNTLPVKRSESPIYENIDDVINELTAMEKESQKESAILQELTKAADQILQAVNGYTDDDSIKHSTDDDDDSRKYRIKNMKKTGEILSTISETKSWKQSTKEVVGRNYKNSESRVRATSSNSSIESISRDSQKPVPPVRLNRATKLNEEKVKKKIMATNSELNKKATRARRLQRASSREALLQSHGSSSEDMTNSTEVIRKPRLVKKSKYQQSSITIDNNQNNSVKKSTFAHTNVTKKRENESRRSADRVPVIGLQEIRHKTAISTIKSTAEKAANREKAMKTRSEDTRKKVLSKKDTAGNKGSNNFSSLHHSTTTALAGQTTIATALGSSSSCVRSDRRSGVVEYSSPAPVLCATAMAAVRTSSGVATKKFNRIDGITKY